MVVFNDLSFPLFSFTRISWAQTAYGGSYPYGNYTRKTKLMFVMGTVDSTTIMQDVEDEHAQYRDVLQGE